MPGLKRSIDPQEKLLHHHYDMMISHGPKVAKKLAASIAEEKTYVNLLRRGLRWLAGVH
jgi:hypothetical protein